MGEDAPITITELEADRVADGENGKMNFKLIQVIQSSSGKVDGGQMTSTTKAYEVKSWKDALENLDWD